MIREVKLGDFIVIQRKSDLFFNATRLINDHCNNLGDMRAEDVITNFLEDEDTEELGRMLHIELPARLDSKKFSNVWFHPVLFICFCSYVSVKLSYQIALTVVEMGGLLHMEESEEIDGFKDSIEVNEERPNKCIIVHDLDSDLYSFVATFKPNDYLKPNENKKVIFEMPGKYRKKLLVKYIDQKEGRNWYRLNEDDIIEIYQMTVKNV